MPINIILKLAEKFKSLSGRLLLTGGQVRDNIRAGTFNFGQVRGDFDFLALGLDMQKILAAARTVGPARVVVRKSGPSGQPSLVRLRQGPAGFDISPPKSCGEVGLGDLDRVLEQDALERDFTVNSIYYDPLDRRIYDPLGGMESLAARRLALCSSEAVEKDPLRLLRAMVLISRRGFTASGAFLKTAQASRSLLSRVAPDRFWPEWRRWSLAGQPHLGLWFLWETGLIKFWPSLAKLADVPQVRRFHPEGDAFKHTVLVVQAMSELRLPEPERRAHLTLAALLHDIGKPVVIKFNEYGKPITSGHSSAGVAVARDFLRSVRAPEEIVKKVARLVRWHMELAFKPITGPDLRAVARKLEPYADLVDFWAVSAADWNGRRPLFEMYPYSLAEFLEPVAGEIKAARPPLDGADLIRLCNFSPGPEIGQALKKLARAYDSGEVKTHGEALEFVRRKDG
ncbi:MAG: HD domain-containing protein [Deltaproteobacteria bacterium]|jgi:tRNA nucleotidyltransferase/poly(A) polymerase|nr:HD domain-containing protein [Deltaproteobacteria bacterium]